MWYNLPFHSTLLYCFAFLWWVKCVSKINKGKIVHYSIRWHLALVHVRWMNCQESDGRSTCQQSSATEHDNNHICERRETTKRILMAATVIHTSWLCLSGTVVEFTYDVLHVPADIDSGISFKIDFIFHLPARDESGSWWFVHQFGKLLGVESLLNASFCSIISQRRRRSKKCLECSRLD